ncbi:MAG: twin-arginine translocase TatA/TatE family subunit [Ardenticatenaceae bacterium]
MEILNVGLSEILLIFILALLVFGPERLPEIARQAGRLFAQVRGAVDEVQRTIMTETKPVRDTFEEARREIEATAKPITDVQREIASTTDPIKRARQDLDAGLRNVKQSFKPVSRSLPYEVTDEPEEGYPEAAPSEDGENGDGSALPSYEPVARGEVNDDDAG